MEPLVCIVNSTDKQLTPLKYSMSNKPNLPLLKYSNVYSNQLAINTLQLNANYPLLMDFDLKQMGKMAQNLMNEFHFNQTLAEWWEIMMLCQLWETTGTLYSMSHSTIAQSIADDYTHLTSKQIKTVANYQVADTLFYKYSDVSVNENAAIEFIIHYLTTIIDAKIGSNSIIQLMNLETNITAQIITYLSSIYTQSYLIKPTITSLLDNTHYLVNIQLKTKLNLIMPPFTKENYLVSLGITVPDIVSQTIICVNSVLGFKRCEAYQWVKSMLEQWTGEPSKEVTTKQAVHNAKWFEVFLDKSKSKDVMDKTEYKLAERLRYLTQLNELY